MTVYRRQYDVDIIIPGWGNLDLTRRCLASIVANTPGPEYQVTYIDNGSRTALAREGPWALLAEWPQVQGVCLPFNHGYCRGVNVGLALANLSPAKYVLLLNNDVEVVGGDVTWLRRLCEALESDPRNGIAGAMTNEAFAPQWAPRPGIASHGVEQVHLLTNFASLLRKEAMRRVGFLDERFEPGNYDDFDYVLRLREAGWKAVVAKSVWLHHQVHATFKQQPEEFQRLMKINAVKFAEKWPRERLLALGVETVERTERRE